MCVRSLYQLHRVLLLYPLHSPLVLGSFLLLVKHFFVRLFSHLLLRLRARTMPLPGTFSFGITAALVITFAVLAALNPQQLEWWIPQTFVGKATTLIVVVLRHPCFVLGRIAAGPWNARTTGVGTVTISKSDAFVLHLQAEASRVTSRVPLSVMHAGLRVVAATDKRNVLRVVEGETKEKFAIFRDRSPASRFAKAVFLSHVRVLEMIAERRSGARVDGAGRPDRSSAEWAAVFEDGAVFTAPLGGEGLRFVPPEGEEIDLVMVGKREEQLFLTLGPPGRRRVISGFGTIGYAVNTSAIGKVLGALSTYESCQPIDLQLVELSAAGILNVFASGDGGMTVSRGRFRSTRSIPYAR